MDHKPTTAKDLLDLVADYVQARHASEPADLQPLVQRFDVALGEYIADQASVRNEG